ncbi:sugar tyrosine-protein kinase [Azospirillum sp. TSO35-2]|nr:sugar tyrosine-protein kinase [Azospirillum sp. TSO35-2]
MALGLLVVALLLIVGSVVVAPSITVILATLLAWLNLAYLVGVTLTR